MVPSEKPFLDSSNYEGIFVWSIMEFTPQLKYTIREPKVEDAFAIRKMHAQSWRDTYQNDEKGVTEKWLRQVTDAWLSVEGMAKTIEHYKKCFSDPDQLYRVAELNGEIVGMIHILTKDDGSKHLGALYTAKETHGTGLAHQLIDLANEWIGNSDVDLEVVTYNERAIRFYTKSGFEIIPGENKPFKDKLPNITMIRKGDAK